MAVARSHRTALAFSLLGALLPAACNRGGSQSRRVVGGLADFGALATDGARQRFCAADQLSGRLLVIDPADGDTLFDLQSIGGSVGGLLHDHCSDSCYTAVSSRNRIDVFDPALYFRRSTIRLRASPFAMAPGAGGRLLVVTSAGLIDLDPKTLTQNTLLPTVERDALLVTDRESRFACLVETLNGAAVVNRFDLANLAAPPITSATGTMPGRVIAAALDFDGELLYVATDKAPGIHRLDAATLAQFDTIDVGDGLSGMALSSTGLRLFYSTTGPLVESIIVEPRLPGPSVTLPDVPRERGVALSATNQELAVWSGDGSITTNGIFEFVIRAPSVLRQGEAGTLTLEGRPNALYFLFLSGGPAPLLLDKPSKPEPRLLELSLVLGYALVAQGQLDGAGRATVEDIVPPGLSNEPIDAVWQAAQTDAVFPPRYELSNAMFIRFLGPDCP